MHNGRAISIIRKSGLGWSGAVALLLVLILWLPRICEAVDRNQVSLDLAAGLLEGHPPAGQIGLAPYRVDPATTRLPALIKVWGDRLSSGPPASGWLQRDLGLAD